MFLTNVVTAGNMHCDGDELKEVRHYKYLGQDLRVGRDNQKCEIFRRIETYRSF